MNHFTVASYTVSHIFLLLFIYLFILHRFSKRTTILICLCSFLALRALDSVKLVLFPDSSLCYVVATIIQIIITQSTALLIARGKNSQTLFVALSASSYVIAGSVFATIMKIWTGNAVLSLAGSIAMHLTILVILSVKIRRICLRFQKKTYGRSWWELCLIPVFFYCSFSFTAFFPHTLYDNPDNIPGIMFAVITMFVSYVVVLHYLESEAERNAIYWESILQKSYIQGLESRHCLVEQAEQNLKILHHDIRHYSKLIDSLLEQRNYEEIRAINAHISHMADENKVEQYCDNLIVNTTLSDMMMRARSLKIQVNLGARVPREMPVNDYEFTLVVANLFENAIHCLKEFDMENRTMEMKIRCSREELFVETSNPYQEELLLDRTTGLPKSRKSGNHGLGMQSILAFSEKINGTVGCSLEDGVFHLMLYAKF